jgi:hypothetical protein
MYRVLLPVGGDVDHVLAAADAVASLPNAADEVETVMIRGLKLPFGKGASQ